MNDEFNWTPDELQAIVDEHALVLFMKGEPGAPQCGFSNRAAPVSYTHLRAHET